MANPASAKEIQEVKKFVADIWQKNIIMGQEAIVSLAEEYRTKYGNWVECHLYHVMIGSTPSGTPAFADFPGADSILARLQNILNSI